MITWLGNRFKTEYIMRMTVDKPIKKQGFNSLSFVLGSDRAMLSKLQQDFIHPSLFKKGRWIFAYLGEELVAFANVVLKGEKGDFFNVTKSDLYLSKLFTFPKYRCQGVMKEVISHCINEFGWSGGITEVSLSVRTNNIPAQKCYTNLGFHITSTVRFIRIYRDIIFPRYDI